jgi:hypothetical protein
MIVEWDWKRSECSSKAKRQQWNNVLRESSGSREQAVALSLNRPGRLCHIPNVQTSQEAVLGPPSRVRSALDHNAGDKGAEQTRARNAIFKSPTHLIHFLNNYMLK